MSMKPSPLGSLRIAFTAVSVVLTACTPSLVGAQIAAEREQMERCSAGKGIRKFAATCIVVADDGSLGRPIQPVLPEDTPAAWII